MSDYIKRSDILNEIENLRKTPWYKEKHANILECFERQNAVYFVENFCVKNVPSVDAKEVVHAKWLGKPLGGYSTVRCSNCNMTFKENSGRWKYCPECGAKMEE